MKIIHMSDVLNLSFVVNDIVAFATCWDKNKITVFIRGEGEGFQCCYGTGEELGIARERLQAGIQAGQEPDLKRLGGEEMEMFNLEHAFIGLSVNQITDKLFTLYDSKISTTKLWAKAKAIHDAMGGNNGITN